MTTNSIRSYLFTFAIFAASLSASTAALAKCGCPADGNWNPAASRGLGESFPDAIDLAADPAWQVYEFERDGIRYVQVNDFTGKVRASAGRIGGTAWVMPIGADADRVAVPGDAMPIGVPRVLYRGANLEVVLYQDGSQTRWLIRPLSAVE